MPNPNEPPGGHASLEVEERALKKGRGRMVAGMAVAGVGAVAALVLYMASGGDEAHAQFGRQVNGLDQGTYDAFWGCVMQGYDLSRLRSDQDLRSELHQRAEQGRDRFGAHVRDECMPRLAELEPELERLVPPEGMGPPLRDLTGAVKQLRGSFSDFVAHLDGLDEEEPYDREAASEPVGRIAKAWYDYSVALSELNARLKQELEG
ncbi:MAG: hypothetical protein ACODAU_04905 [Myxococcota bacterium]